MDARVKVKLSAGEVVPSGKKIDIEFGAAFCKPAGASVRLVTARKTLPLKLELSEHGRRGHVCLPRDVVGSCELQIAPEDKKQRKLARIPFSIVALAGSVTDGLRIEHAVRVRVGELAVDRLRVGASTAPFVDVLKVSARDGRGLQQLAFDDRGNLVDYAALLAEMNARRAAKYGKIHETLFERMQIDADQPIDIAVWPVIWLSPAPYPKSTREPKQEVSCEEEKVQQGLSEQAARLCGLLAEADIKEKPALSDVRRPYVRARATSAQIRALAQLPEVGGIYFDDSHAVDDLHKSIELSRADNVLATGLEGTGIRVAVWEKGADDKTLLELEASFLPDGPATPTSDHARLTTAIIKNIEPDAPHGYAPGCLLYAANMQDVGALEWAAEHKCTVVNQSFHFQQGALQGSLQLDDLQNDYIALFDPCPTIVQAAGNQFAGDEDGAAPPEREFVNHKGYNTLTVASHDEMLIVSSDSTFRNPDSPHGDRELPSLSANGTTVSAVKVKSFSGTSFAAPAVAGVVALIQSVDKLLRSWPEGCRAIMLASARRQAAAPTWIQNVQARVDAKGGAGALDAEAAVRIARGRRDPGTGAAAEGWDVLQLTADSLDAEGISTFKYALQAPASSIVPQATVSLCWNGGIASPDQTVTSPVLAVDLDLCVRDATGDVVAVSSSWDNSYEIAQFFVEPGETYEISIRRLGSQNAWVGIAWMVGDL